MRSLDGPTTSAAATPLPSNEQSPFLLGPEPSYWVKTSFNTCVIESVKELIRPCGTIRERQLRRMLQGSFVITADEFAHNDYCCVIKLNHGGSEPVESESSKYDWLKHRVNEARFASLRKELKRSQPATRKNPHAVPGCIDRYSLSDDGSYLVLENHYRDVRALIHDVPADPRWGDYRALKGMLKALRALHSLQVVHCNIKPENILYRVNDDFECVVKFCDLRCACEPGDEVRLPVPATCSYLSFDAFHSVVHAQRTEAAYGMDIFALALVMWQILRRSTSSPLPVRSMFYTQERHLAPLWLSEEIKRDATSGSEGASRAVRSLAHYASFLMHMMELSFVEDCSHLTVNDLLDLLEDLEPVDAVLVKLDGIFGAVQGVGRKLDTFKTIKARVNGLQKAIIEIAACSQASAQQGAYHANTLKTIASSVAKGVHALTTAISTQSATISELKRAVLQGLTDMRCGFSCHADNSLQAYASLMGVIDTHLGDIAGELSGIAEANQQDHRTRAQLARAVTKLSDGLHSAQTTLMHAHAAIKAEAASQAQWRNASSVTMHSLLTGEYAVPTRFVLLPELVDNTWMGMLNPMRWAGNKYRLYFVCEQTHQIVCGPDLEGYVVQQLQDWVVQAAPYVQIALVAASAALVISGVPFPISKWCQIPADVPHQTKYLRAAFTFIQDAAGSTAGEYTAEQLAAMDDLNEDDLTCGEHDRARAAQLISDLKDRKVITDWSGLVLVSCTVSGHSAWVRDNAVIQQAWKDAWPSRLHKQVEALVRMHTGSIVAVGRAMQYDLLFNEQAVVRVENLVKDIISAAETLDRQGAAEDPQNRIEECSTALSEAVAMFAPTGSRDTLLHASRCYAERDSDLRKEIFTRVEHMRATAPHHVATAWQKATVAITEGLKASVAKLRQLVDDTRCLRDFRTSSAKAVSDSIELSECVQVLTSPGTKRNCPQLPVLLPSVPRGWKGAGQPLRLQKNKCRLLFLCSHTKLPLLCGLDGAGHYITADAASVNKLAPVVQISLLLLASALKRPECGALPVMFFGAKLNTKELQLQYVNAVLDLMTKPVSVNEETYTLDEVSSEVGDANQMDLEALQHDHTYIAYNELLRLLQLHSLQRDKCSEWGMRLVGHLWVTDSDEIEAEVAPLLASP
jgi:hypothetical protein